MPRKSTRRVTSYDVARAAGVSQSAVSRSFQSGVGLRQETRDRILKVAANLGYQPDAIARGLAVKRTNIVALLVSDFLNVIYPEVLSEISHALSFRDIRVLLFALRGDEDVGAALTQVWRHRVDGAIANVRFTDAQIGMFRDRQVPLVLYNRISDGVAVNTVCCDSAAGERALVDKLLAAGHRRFGIIAGPEGSYVGTERVRAALTRLAEAGLTDVPLVRGDYSYESGAAGLRELKAGGHNLDALVAVNDLMAMGAMDAAARDFGLRVPQDLSVVGFDGMGPAGWGRYALTTMRQPVRHMAEAAVAMLMDRIADPELLPERRVFAVEYCAGTSARVAPEPHSP